MVSTIIRGAMSLLSMVNLKRWEGELRALCGEWWNFTRHPTHLRS